MAVRHNRKVLPETGMFRKTEGRGENCLPKVSSAGYKMEQHLG
jgi:hypothetical protein